MGGDISVLSDPGKGTRFMIFIPVAKEDVNIESINFDFGLSYALSNLYGLEVKYYVYNFDDFLVRDQYYTSNIAELNLIRNISF